mgnify:CR=1 FL=1
MFKVNIVVHLVADADRAEANAIAADMAQLLRRHDAGATLCVTANVEKDDSRDRPR